MYIENVFTLLLLNSSATSMYGRKAKYIIYISQKCKISTYLFQCHGEQLVAGRLPHGQHQAVDGVQGGAQEAAEAQLLAALQPAVQPAGEAAVLGAPAQLQGGGAQAGQVDQRQQDQGGRGQGDVHRLYGHLVEDVLPLRHVGLQDVAGKVVRVEEGEEQQRAEQRGAPAGEEVQGEVLHVQGGGQQAHVHGDEAQAAAQLRHRALGLKAVAAQENLEDTATKTHPSTSAEKTQLPSAETFCAPFIKLLLSLLNFFYLLHLLFLLWFFSLVYFTT